ncbi:hypothetical protein [Teichococcus aestuarii]|uniref:hypothetical protein n=1 Tax=Teichococcus aestuarii TaxID=568898 RepID=UPI0036138C4A
MRRRDTIAPGLILEMNEDGTVVGIIVHSVQERASGRIAVDEDGGVEARAPSQATLNLWEKLAKKFG